MPLQWRDGLSIDGGTIDDDHRYLIELINNYEDLMERPFDREAIVKILNSLKYYTVYHFIREEAAQREVDYPDQETHAAEHRRLIGCVDYAIRLLDQEIEGSRLEAIKSQVARLLNNWLIAHIIKFDIPMRPHFRNVKAFMGRRAPISTV